MDLITSVMMFLSLALFLGINNNHFDIRLQQDNGNCVFNLVIDVRNINKLQFGTNIKYLDVVKLVSGIINISEKRDMFKIRFKRN